MPLTLLYFLADTLSLLFAGDLMQHVPQMNSALERGEETLLSENYDYSGYFRHIEREISAADFAAVNMEFTVGDVPYSGYPRFSAPPAIAAEARKAGFDLFLCANNHICDRGGKGIASTIREYNSIGAPFTGLYTSRLDEILNQPYVIELKGVRIAFINFTYGTNGLAVPDPYVVSMMEKSAVRRAIGRARLSGADIIIALPHWGEEYSLRESREQKQWCDFLLEEGADAVIGSHPHVIQPAYIKKEEITGEDKFILYSMGNLISNMSRENTRVGILCLLKIITQEEEPRICEMELIPIWASLKGGFEKGYTILPIREFLDKEDQFLQGDDYKEMKNTFERLEKITEWKLTR